MKNISYKLFFRAISNNTRFEIINLLRKNSKNVSEICKELDFEQSRVSHNLQCLEDCGFVTSEQNGKNRTYSLDKKTIQPLLDLVDGHIKKYESHLVDCNIIGKRKVSS